MNTTLTDEALKQCREQFQSDRIINAVHFPSAHSMLLASSVGCAFQALIAGSCLQLVYHYFYQPRRDSTLARCGICFVTLTALASLVIGNYQTSRLISYNQRYVAVLFLDWWLYQLSYLIYMFTALPVLLFFTHRAYMIWDRSLPILVLCLVTIIPTFVLGVASASLALRAPWGVRALSNEDFKKWIPEFARLFKQTVLLYKVSVTAQMVASLVCCVSICYGIFRHRNGFAQMDTAISKVIFLCGESLFPVVVISLTDAIRVHLPLAPRSIIISRFTVQIAPLLYFHGFIGSLVSRERVATILCAEPVRQMANFPSDPSGKPDDPSISCHEIDQPGMRDTNGRINWTTMQLEADTGDTAYIPDFVDASKMSYVSNIAGASRRGSRDWRAIEVSAESIEPMQRIAGRQDQGEGRDSLCDLEEMLCTAPAMWTTASGRGKSRERKTSKTSSPRTSSSTTPVKDSATM